MLTAAARAGIRECEAWRMSPRQIRREVEAWAYREKRHALNTLNVVGMVVHGREWKMVEDEEQKTKPGGMTQDDIIELIRAQGREDLLR